MEPDQYCREIESYLCRKNDGHLIRIVGPSFERVRGWADLGIPLTIALHGIDRHFERYYARGPRRRPVHIDFCEADVMDVFDEWRRAVGVRGVADAAVSDGRVADAEEPVRRQPSLRAHIDRLIVRVTALRSGALATSVDLVLERAVRELDGLRDAARHARGEARDRIAARLATFDRDLLGALHESTRSEDRAALIREAEDELAPFKMRMVEADYTRAVEACVQRLQRDRAGLPRFALD